MGVWRIGADELAESRFVVSPLLETVGALLVLRRGGPRLDLADWYSTHRPAFQRQLADDPLLPTLLDGLFRPRWIADFVIPPPDAGDRTFHDALRRNDLGERAANLLEWVWTHTVRADWPRRRQLLEADIVARTGQLTAGGWSAALAGMRPGMRWLGGNELRINAYDYPPRDLTGARLSFVPNTSPFGWVAWDEANRHAVIYPCAGTLSDDRPPSPEALARLLGTARAIVLIALDVPHSTSQLVALTGYGLGSVGGHLAVLLEAGLVTRRRAGRSVLYVRTPLGNRLVATTMSRQSGIT